ncbi:MAG: hypothetical protein ABSA21_13955 [Candidatus Limnocylindrales bacterium]|jgi:hypothetical protein
MKLLAVFVLAVVFGGCATPQPTPSATQIPTPTVTPAPSPTPVFVCPPGDPRGPTLPPGGCAEEERAALAAVSGFGYPVARIEIIPNGWPCGVPFNPPITCLAVLRGPAAYVYFVGTDKVAALTFASGPDGSLTARVVASQAPPPSPTPTS